MANEWCDVLKSIAGCSGPNLKPSEQRRREGEMADFSPIITMKISGKPYNLCYLIKEEKEQLC